MDIESYRDYCLTKKGVSEGFPFDEKTLVFKVGGKMFALTDVDLFESINLKCEPEYALELRAEYEGIAPGYHMSKTHWNTVKVNQDVPDTLLIQLIDLSYNLVHQSLPKSKREEIEKGV